MTGQRSVSSSWRKLRARVIKRQGGLCSCGAIATQVHHVDGDARNDEPHNLVALCYECHLSAHGQRRTLRAR